MRAFIFDGFVIFGALVMTLGVVGMLRMPDVYTKLHGASKSVFLGVMVLALSGIVIGGEAISSRLFLICLALALTTPVASHVIGRAAFVRHEQMETAGAIDESHSLQQHDETPTWRV